MERLTNLLAVLCDTRRPLTVEEILERIPGYPPDPESARRQFERDKDALRGIGVPLNIEAPDVFGEQVVGYRVRRTDYELPEMELTVDELAALHAAVAAVRLEGGEGRQALWKLGGGEGPQPPPVAGLELAPSLPAFLEASEQRADVTFRYRGEPRHLDPFAIVFRGGHWYVVGHDRDRGELRSFRSDRVEGQVEVGTPGAFERPADFDPDEVLHDEPWRYGTDAPVEALVEVDAAVAPWVVGRLGDEAVREERDDGSVVVALTVTNRGAFRSFVLDLLDHAVVLGPAELRDDLVAWLEAVAGAGS